MPGSDSLIKTLAKMKEGKISLIELGLKSLEKSQKFKHLNAFTFVTSKTKIEQRVEELSQREDQTLKLRGIPIAIKDNFCVEGMPTTCGSKMLQNFMPPYTATIPQKLINAGAIIIGKTNMDEFGMGNGTIDSISGHTKNIWGLEKYTSGKYSYDDWHVPGGSSGGSAVAVASGIVLGAIGSDTGGSTRNPASYCGVVGLKPTYGVLSRFGLIPLVNSMDVPGILTKNVQDCEYLFDILKGVDSKDSTSINHKNPSEYKIEENIDSIKIGIPDEFNCEGLTDEVKNCWDEIVKMLQSQGSKVKNVSLPHTKYSISCYSILNTCEVASNMARYDGLRFGHRTTKKDINSTEALYAQNRHEGFNSVVRGRILAGNFFLLKNNYEKFYSQAMKVRRLISNDFDKVWKCVDLLLTPVTLSSAPKYSEFIKWDNRKQSSIQDFCTQSANMAGVPALSLPIKLNSQGLPISLQIIGPPFSEHKIFNLAKYIENVINFEHLKF